MAKDLLENLFDSIDLIVTNKLGDLNYDKTEQCTIVEVKGNKEYYVSNGAAKYVAYAQNDAEYKEGDSVYVTIPQGNYDNQKLIIGKHTAKKSTATDWVSPMESFVNITGSIVPAHAQVGLIANSPSVYLAQIWKDTATEPYVGFDRLCITGDFLTDFSEDLVIEGSYGLMLKGKIEDTRLESELKELTKQISEVNASTTFSETVKAEKIAALEKKIAETKEKYKLTGEQDFICFFDSKDMLGNPYDFGVPFRQEKLLEVEPTSKISNLELYFYQGVSDDQTWSATFKDVNNKLIAVNENPNIFVENTTINFGYSFETYTEDTAVLYTLDKTRFDKNEAEQGARELRLRWVHFDDNQKPHSIRDINDSSLNYHYVKVHWYRYEVNDKQTEPDPLAGYFWKEIKDNEDKFSYKTKLNLDWHEEKFKVIIQYDDKFYKSEELVFDNPGGTIQYGKLITGLKIKFPEDDTYKGTFYIYGDDYNAGFSTERTFDLIAEYETISENGKVWDDTDVICWKFPAQHTMLHKPEKGFEYNISSNEEEHTDVFLDADAVSRTVEVNGVSFTTDPLYHQIIRQIKVAKTYDSNGNITATDSLASRTQKYRVKGMFNGGSNNTIRCEVYKPTIDMVYAEQPFTFGLHTTNGTKYTLAVDWEETAASGTHQRPPAITYHDTQNWKFSIEILDANQQKMDAPDGGWIFELSWYEDRANDYVNGVNDLIKIDNANKTIVVQNWDTEKYMNHAQYQILQIKVTNFDYALTTRIPIPIRSRRDILGLDGADRIYYDSAGYNPRWSDQAYKLIWASTTEEANIPTAITWGIKNTDKNFGKDNYIETYFPELKDTNYLFAPDTFLGRVKDADDTTPNDYEGVCVFAKDGNNILWLQPIYVTMDAYGSQFFNEWDGKMKIDEENGVIMSSVIGAGKKDSENRYSGVVLGEVNKVLDKDRNVATNAANTGILGFHEGVQSFSLLNDGTATFGKSGRGQIKFDGNNGTIQSAKYVESTDGMQIDLDDAKISTPRVWIDGDDENNNPYFKIADSKNATQSYFEVSSDGKVHMGKWTLDNSGQFKGLNDNKYTLMAPPGSNTGSWVFASGSTSNDDWSNAPFRVNEKGEMYATQGTIGGWNIMPTYIDSFTGTDRKTDPQKRFYLAAHADSSSYLIYAQGLKTNSTTEYERKFSVDENGTLYAKDADIAGKITATSGEIQNCTIENCTVNKIKIDNESYDWSSVSVVSSIDSLDITADWVPVVDGVYPINDWIYYNGYTKTEYENTLDIVPTKKSKSVTWNVGRNLIYLRLISKIKINYSTKNMRVLGAVSGGGGNASQSFSMSTTEEPSGGGCFIAGSKILMEDYSLKNIEDIKIGDVVVTYNQKKNIYEASIVTDTYTKDNTINVIDIYFDDDSILTMTTCHPILSTDGWKSLDHCLAFIEHGVLTQDLTIGQEIIGINKNIKIEKIIYRDNIPNFKTYNITVPKNNTFIVNGIVAHNAMLKPGIG